MPGEQMRGEGLVGVKAQVIDAAEGNKSVDDISMEYFNGNTLIAETDVGRVFEVTTDGEIVWELWTPLLGKPKEGKAHRAVYYRVIRITDPTDPVLKALGLSTEGF